MSKPSAIEEFRDFPQARYVFRINDAARTRMAYVTISAPSRDAAIEAAVAAFDADPAIVEAFPEGAREISHVNTVYE